LIGDQHETRGRVALYANYRRVGDDSRSGGICVDGPLERQRQSADAVRERRARLEKLLRGLQSVDDDAENFRKSDRIERPEAARADAERAELVEVLEAPGDAAGDVVNAGAGEYRVKRGIKRLLAEGVQIGLPGRRRGGDIGRGAAEQVRDRLSGEKPGIAAFRQSLRRDQGDPSVVDRLKTGRRLARRAISCRAGQRRSPAGGGEQHHEAGRA
jgi:hypothetical protein